MRGKYKNRVWENERNKESEKESHAEEETPDTKQGSLEGRHALLFKRTFPLFTLPLPFPFFISC